MSEEKRFKYVRCDGFTDNGMYMPPNAVVDLLNVLYDENCRLKDWNKCLVDKKHNTLELLNSLSNENEQLKQNIQEAYETERTTLGRNVLKQLLNNLE